MIRLECRSRFDITTTGTTGYFKPERLPFVDGAGVEITCQQQWVESRNQNRNWETIIQIISLRTQIFEPTTPRRVNDWWRFEFSVDSVSVYSDGTDSELNILKADANNVPMIICKDSEMHVEMTDTQSTDANLVFAILA